MNGIACGGVSGLTNRPSFLCIQEKTGILNNNLYYVFLLKIFYLEMIQPWGKKYEADKLSPKLSFHIPPLSHCVLPFPNATRTSVLPKRFC